MPDTDESIRSEIIGAIVIGTIMVICISAAIALSPLFKDMGLQAFGEEGAENPFIPFFYIGIVVVMAVVIVLLIKFNLQKVIHVAFMGAIFFTIIFLLAPIGQAILIQDPEWDSKDLSRTPDHSWMGEIDGKATLFYSSVYDIRSMDVESGSDTVLFTVSSPVVDIRVYPENLLVVVMENDVVMFDLINDTSPKNPWQHTNMIIFDPVDYHPGGGGTLLTKDKVYRNVGTSLETYDRADLEIPEDWDRIVFADMSVFAVYGPTGIGLFDSSGKRTTFSGHVTSAIQANILGDDTPEIVVAGAQRVLVFDINLELKKKIDVGKPTNVLGASTIQDMDHESLVVGTEKGVRIYYNTPDGTLEGLMVLDDAKGLAGDPSAVYLYEEDSVTLKVYSVSNGKVQSLDIDLSFKPWIVPGIISGVIALIIVLLLFFYGEWYIVDLTGGLLAVGVLTILGISLSILPLCILLVLLAIYDAIAVYKTKHMITMASSVMEMKLPVLLVIPKTREYSFRKQESLNKQLKEKKKRDALFIGLGDIIIPGTLAVSAFTFLPSDPILLGIGGNLIVAVFTMIGMLTGFGFLMKLVLSGKPQAGLPLLNSGAIFGYMLGYLLIFQDLTLGFGISLGVFW